MAIEGKKAFHIGNICGTCAFFFERMEGANQSVNAEKVQEALNKGIRSFDGFPLKELEKIMPDGKYITTLSQAMPGLTQPGDENDYFAKEEVALWGVDGFWGLPHSPKTEYYRLVTSGLNEDTGFFEFLIPTFPHNWLDEKRVSAYRESIRHGSKPSMVAISVLDIKQPCDWEGEKDITSHWCLAHYLVDGHHKAYAAALEGLPITLISFLALEQGISSEEDINLLISKLKEV